MATDTHSPQPEPRQICQRGWCTPGFWWFAGLTLGVLAGLVALTAVMLFGHTHEMNVGWEPPWGILVVTAHVLSLASAGLCLVVPLLLPRDWVLPSEVSQKGLMTAGTTFVGALAIAVVELSQPVRLSLNADLGEGFLPGVYLTLAHSLVFIGCLAATCYALARGRRRLGLLFAGAGFVVALVALFKSEALLALFGFGASWLSAALVPVAAYSALALGGALMTLVVVVPFWLGGKGVDGATEPLVQRQVLLLRVLLAVQLLFVGLALYGGAAWGGERFALVSQLLVSGPLGKAFWLGEVLFGLLLPLALLLLPGRRPCQLWLAALFALFGQYMFWYNLLLVTQLAEMLTVYRSLLPGMIPRVTPCLPKFLISFGSFCLVLLLLSLNEKLQPYRS